MSLALSCSIGNAVSSDHAPLYLVYSLTEDRALSQRWRFQPCLFKDDKFISYFISRLDSEVLKELVVLGCMEFAAHSKGVVFASNHFGKFFQVRPRMYKGWLVFLATNPLAGAWLGHFAQVLLSLCYGHLRTWCNGSRKNK